MLKHGEVISPKKVKKILKKGEIVLLVSVNGRWQLYGEIQRSMDDIEKLLFGARNVFNSTEFLIIYGE
jgi:hypothetical protein